MNQGPPAEVDVITLCPLCVSEGNANPIELETEWVTANHRKILRRFCAGGHGDEAIRHAILKDLVGSSSCTAQGVGYFTP